MLMGCLPTFDRIQEEKNVVRRDGDAQVDFGLSTGLGKRKRELNRWAKVRSRADNFRHVY